MAVPSSGQLKILGIFSEKNENDYTANNADGENSFSLRGLSSNSHGDSTGGNINLNSGTVNKPDQAAPHRMSEFYGYDHDVVIPSFSGNPPSFEVYTPFTSNPPSGLTLSSQTSPGHVRVTLSSYGISVGGSGQSIVSSGFVFATNSNQPTISDTITNSNGFDVTHLGPGGNGWEYGTIYYFRAWAQLSGGGVGYSATQELYMTSGPVLTTQAASSITSSGATLSGNMTDNGVPDDSGLGGAGANHYQAEKGWLVSVSTAPNASTPGLGNSTKHQITPSSSGFYDEGSFTKSITGLSGGTTYYARAYARMDKRPYNVYEPGLASFIVSPAVNPGYGFGNVISFTTSVSYNIRYTDGPHQKNFFACYQTASDVIKYTGTFGNGTTVYDNNLNLITSAGWYNGPNTTSGSSGSSSVFYVNNSGVVSNFTLGLC